MPQPGRAFVIKLLPVALQAAIEEDVDFRRSLPIDYLEYMGVANDDFDTSQMVRTVDGMTRGHLISPKLCFFM